MDGSTPPLSDIAKLTVKMTFELSPYNFNTKKTPTDPDNTILHPKTVLFIPRKIEIGLWDPTKNTTEILQGILGILDDHEAKGLLMDRVYYQMKWFEHEQNGELLYSEPLHMETVLKLKIGTFIKGMCDRVLGSTNQGEDSSLEVL